MQFVNIVLYLALSLQYDVFLLRGIPGCDPTRICEINGYDDVVVNSNNISYLISMLVNNHVESAAVGGWNDHVPYNLVLRSNGALAPYQRFTNNADFALCIKQGNGCHRKRDHAPHSAPVCPPQPCPPQPTPICPPRPVPICPPQPCPPRPSPICPPQPWIPRPCPPQPCQPKPWIPRPRPHESSSSESSLSRRSSTTSRSMRKHSSRRSKVCPKYVKQKRIGVRNKKPCKPNEDWVKCCLENIRVVKTFVFNERDLYDCGRIKLKEFTSKSANQCKVVELRPLCKEERLQKHDYPALLRFPCFLLNFKKYVTRKYHYSNPCLYIDCRGRLYVRIRDTLYGVVFLHGTEFNEKCTFKHIKLCPIKGKPLQCLIQEGLAGIAFEGGFC